MPTKKEWLKHVNEIENSFYAEALIVQLEARIRQLKDEFKSKSL